MIQVCYLIVISLTTLTAGAIDGEPCTTPKQRKGICKSFSECTSLVKTLDSTSSVTTRFIQESKLNCTMDLVCCESSNNQSLSTFKENITLSTISDGTTCGLDKLTTRIVGGKIVDFGEFPWLVAIEMESKIDAENNGIRCGGSIITKRYILTAAHCLNNREFTATKVWLGATNIGPEGNCLNISSKLECLDSIKKMNIVQKMIHPLYRVRDSSNDIGLVQVDKTIEYNDQIRPVCLPSQDLAMPLQDTITWVAGWGTTKANGNTSYIKLKVDLPVKDNSVCNAFLKIKQSTEITTRQLCVGGEKEKDSCQGDSGGPLIKKFVNENGDTQWYQEGIVSFGLSCGVDRRQGIYTRVSTYIRWISDTIDNLQVNLGKGDPCTTPNGTIGTCVPLNTCPEVFNAASTKNQDGYLFAIDSKCGYNNEQLVCCRSPASIIEPNFDSKALPDKSTCGNVKDKPRIYGGEVADLGEFPWAVVIKSISRKTNTIGEYRCVGSVINKRYVLTTAKCLTHAEFEPVSVVVGDWNITSDPDCKELLANIECADPVQKIPIKETIPHIFYSGVENRNDIGLILLENDIKFSDYVAPLCLSSPNLPPLELGIRLTVIGWGKTADISKPDTLRKVEIPLVSNDKCNRVLGRTELLRHKIIGLQHLCVGGERGKDTCSGDGGSPLMRIYEDKTNGKMQWYQEGLTSFGLGCGNGRPAIYTKVSSFTNWIINIISED